MERGKKKKKRGMEIKGEWGEEREGKGWIGLERRGSAKFAYDYLSFSW